MPRCPVSGLTFVHTAQESVFAKSIDMPLPELCPEERFRQLMATRNEWKLYHRTCDATEERILSAYAADSPYTVYKNDVWWGDTWEALDNGREFDFSRPFFEQFHALQLAVPREGTSIFQCENCDYNSHIRQSKNCYLNSLVVRAEDMHYCYWMVDIEDALDSCFHITGRYGKSVRCYECIDFSACHTCVALQECRNCSECSFGFQLQGCDHCLFCSNLANKSYHIGNRPCTKAEYDALHASIFAGSYRAWTEALDRYARMRQQALHRASTALNSEHVEGDHLFDCKHCENCFDGDHSEDCDNAISLNDSADIHSCYSAGWTRCEQLWNCAVSRGCSGMAFCRYMWFCNDMRYCDSCQTCKHCFGCIGLRHKDHCILNKQYAPAEYEELKRRIIEHMKRTGEWGRFWPFQYLPFAYNESAAQDYYPLTREEAMARGFRWRDVPAESPGTGNAVPAADLPDALDDTAEETLQRPVLCGVTGKPFKIIPQELQFYCAMRLPLPRVHPEERHRRRMARRKPYKLYDRVCSRCGRTLRSTYGPDRPEAIACEDCYRKEVY